MTALNHNSGQFYTYMATFFVNLALFYYTRDLKRFDHEYAVKENKIAFLIGLYPTIVVSIVIIVIALTRNGMTIDFPLENRWIYIICISIIFLSITRKIIYRLHGNIMKGKEYISLDEGLYKRYITFNLSITFLPLIIMFLTMYLVYS